MGSKMLIFRETTFLSNSTYQRSFDIGWRPGFHSNEKGRKAMIFVLNINEVNAITITRTSTSVTNIRFIIVQSVQRGRGGQATPILIRWGAGLVKPGHAHIFTASHSPLNVIVDHSSTVWTFENFSVCNVRNLTKVTFWKWQHATIGFTKNVTDRKILKCPHCVVCEVCTVLILI